MKLNSKKILYYILFLHLLLWTIIPTIFNTNLPLDTIEGLVWGNELKLGYEKYPPIFPLFTELFYLIFGNQDWAYYFLSQLFVVLSFLVIFELSKYFFQDDLHRLLSVLLLECIYFLNYTTPELNAFIPLFLFNSLTALFCWKAIRFNKNSDWILFGVFAGISTLTYYLALYLLASLSIFFIREIFINKKINHKYFLALITYFIILSPHLYYIYSDNFKSIEYALFRSFGDPLSGISVIKIFDHIFYPIIFLVKQFLILVPLFIFVRLVAQSFKTEINFSDKKLVFLIAITFLPIFLMFLTSIIGGIRIRTMWMTTFYMFPGIFFIYVLRNKIIAENFKKFLIIFLIVFISLPVIYGAQSYIQTDKRTDFPGKKIASEIQREWDKNFNNKIKIVVGDGWVYGGWYGGNLSYHLADRPKLRYKIKDNYLNEGLVKIDILNSIKFCDGVLLKIDPYFDSCLLGKVNN